MFVILTRDDLFNHNRNLDLAEIRGVHVRERETICQATAVVLVDRNSSQIRILKARQPHIQEQIRPMSELGTLIYALTLLEPL